MDPGRNGRKYDDIPERLGLLTVWILMICICIIILTMTASIVYALYQWTLG